MNRWASWGNDGWSCIKALPFFREQEKDSDVAVRVDENDRIFVLEANRHRVQVYDKVKDYEEHPLNL